MAIPGMDISAVVRRRIENLPLPALEKYKQWKKLDRIRNGTYLERQSEHERLRGELNEAYRDLAAFDRAHAQRRLDKQQLKERAAKVERIEEVKAEIKALNAEPLPPGGHAEQIDNWLAVQPHAFRMRNTKLNVRKGRNKLELYEMVTGAIVDFRKQIETDKKLKLTPAEGIQQAIADLDKLAAEGEINVSRCFRLGKIDVEDRNYVQGHVKWPVIEIPNPDNPERPFKIPNGAAMFARIHYDALKAEILKQCAKHDDPNALSREERKLREAEKRATLLDLEYQMYLRFFEARAAGFDVRLPVSQRTGDRFIDEMGGGLVFNPMCALGIERDPNPGQTAKPDDAEEYDFG